MKTLKILAVSAIAMLLAVMHVSAQATGPSLVSAWTNSGVFTCGGSVNGLTNLTAAQKNKLRLNGDGFAVGGTIGSLAALTVTNCYIFLEFSVDGTNAYKEPALGKWAQILVTPDGVGGHTFATNFPPALTSGFDWVAVNSITNANGSNQVFFTNLVLRVPRER